MIKSALKVEIRNGHYCYKKGNYWYVFGEHFPNKWTKILGEHFDNHYTFIR